MNISIKKIIEIIENFELCDIWRIRNPTKKCFTFRQNHYCLHTKQPNEFQYQNTHQDCLYMPHPLFYKVDYL